MLPKIQAEKNNLAFEEAQARLKQLQETYDLKRRAAAADIKILEIRRNRAETNMKPVIAVLTTPSTASESHGVRPCGAGCETSGMPPRWPSGRTKTGFVSGPRI